MPTGVQLVQVDRSSLLNAFRQIASVSPDRDHTLRLSVSYGVLTLATDSASCAVPVNGRATFECQLPGFPIHNAEIAIPLEDPLEIAHDGTTLRFHRLRFRLSPPPTVAPDLAGRLARAAEVLEPYGIGQSDLLPLCNPAPFTDPAQIQPQKDRVASAWAQLSVYGLDIIDLEYLIAQRLRTAWQR